MKKYLLDTNICIYFRNGKFNIEEKLDEVGIENCYISEITIVELKYGIEKSARKDKNRKVIESFQRAIHLLPIFPALDIYAKEKTYISPRDF